MIIPWFYPYCGFWKQNLSVFNEISLETLPSCIKLWNFGVFFWNSENTRAKVHINNRTYKHGFCTNDRYQDIPMMGMYLVKCRTYWVYSYKWGCLAVRGNMVGILVIGSYVYHSDVIVTSTQIYVNRIQIHVTYYLPVYCIYKLVQFVAMFLRYLVVWCVDSGSSGQEHLYNDDPYFI